MTVLSLKFKRTGNIIYTANTSNSSETRSRHPYNIFHYVIGKGQSAAVKSQFNIPPMKHKTTDKRMFLVQKIAAFRDLFLRKIHRHFQSIALFRVNRHMAGGCIPYHVKTPINYIIYSQTLQYRELFFVLLRDTGERQWQNESSSYDSKVFKLEPHTRFLQQTAPIHSYWKLVSSHSGQG